MSLSRDNNCIFPLNIKLICFSTCPKTSRAQKHKTNAEKDLPANMSVQVSHQSSLHSWKQRLLSGDLDRILLSWENNSYLLIMT